MWSWCVLSVPNVTTALRCDLVLGTFLEYGGKQYDRSTWQAAAELPAERRFFPLEEDGSVAKVWRLAICREAQCSLRQQFQRPLQSAPNRDS